MACVWLALAVLGAWGNMLTAAVDVDTYYFGCSSLTNRSSVNRPVGFRSIYEGFMHARMDTRGAFFTTKIHVGTPTSLERYGA